MKNLLNPKWLLIINTAPVIVLLIIANRQYDVIESLLSKEAKLIWQYFGLTLLFLSINTTTYGLYCIYRKKSVSITYAVISLVCYTVFIYVYVLNNSEIIPLSIPQWMITPDVEFYPGTFLMPTLIHALLIIVVLSLPTNRKVNPWLNFLYALIFPLVCYLFMQIVLPLWQTPENNYSIHVMIVVFITITILFLFFICRGVYILFSSKSKSFKKYSLVWNIIIGVILPLIGLFINNGGLGKNSVVGASPFGDFSHPIFYIVVIINGILLCLNNLKNDNYRFLRFLCLIIFFPYILYFFLIFLPFLPFSIVAIIFLGVGFLMLTPLILFIVQSNEIYNEYLYLKLKFTSKKISILSTLCAGLIPLILTCFYLRDKLVLNNALSYVYDNNYQNETHVNKNSLEKTLNTIKSYKGRNNLNPSNKYLPFLTSYYNWLVLDNMVLSEKKIETLEQIFLGEKKISLSNTNINTKTAKIKNLNSFSKYNTKHKFWETRLDIVLQNGNEDGFASYETTFVLPEGCWISDYYLYVGDKKEKGILAEKKSALWVFKQIRNENRDPGILYYSTGNRISFSVFPFGKNEIRKTGITFIHKEPTKINIDGNQIALAEKDNKITGVETIGSVTYIPSIEKAKLTLVQRKPIYHFIVDVSKDNDQFKRSFVQRIESYIIRNKIDRNNIKVNFTNSYTSSIEYTNSWANKLENYTCEGGYYLGGAIKKIILNSYSQLKNSYPIIIAVTNNIDNSIILNDFADLQFAFPESTSFYELDEQNKIWEHSLIDCPLQKLKQIKEIDTTQMVLAWPSTIRPIDYLSNNNLPSIVIKNNKPIFLNEKKNNWEAGLKMQEMWRKSLVNSKNREDEHLEMIRFSMVNQILSPVTSFIVVENEAQKKALRQKQDQILNGNKNLDADEDTQSMSEPGLMLLLISIALFYTIKQYYLRTAKTKIQYGKYYVD